MEEMRYTISDAAKMVKVESHVLRYWEDELSLEIPRNEMGHRYYTQKEVDVFCQIRALKERGFQLKSIKDVMEILFDDRHVVYEFSLLEELEMAYAVTVHKSQGSEYPIVILPIARCAPMLRTRNLLYTAVTRAARMVILVGQRDILAEMVENEHHSLRHTNLKYFLCRECLS